MRKWLLVLSLFVSGCSVVPDSYFEYQKGFDETIVTEYQEYVEKDTTLLQVQKDNRNASVEIWREAYKARLANGN